MAGTKGIRSRQSMLDEAKTVIRESGIESLTHALIASRLGISKSAVLYHFSTKRILWEALVEEYVAHLNAELTFHSRPYVEAGLSEQQAILPAMRQWYSCFKENANGWIDIGAALIGLARHDASLIAPIRQWYSTLYANIARSGNDTTKAFSAMMAFDGFFNAHKLGLFVLDYEKSLALQTFLLKSTFDKGDFELIETVWRKNLKYPHKSVESKSE